MSLSCLLQCNVLFFCFFFSLLVPGVCPGGKLYAFSVVFAFIMYLCVNIPGITSSVWCLLPFVLIGAVVAMLGIRVR